MSPTSSTQSFHAYHALHTAAEQMVMQTPVVEREVREGPQNNETWTVSIKFAGVSYHGKGRSRQDAKQNAALAALNDPTNADVHKHALTVKH